MKKEIHFVVKSFLVWRFFLFGVVLLASKLVPLQKNFLGGGIANYLQAPWLWSWSNFDGEHYLAIAQRGYGYAEQAFFPLFPLIIRYLGGILGNSLTSFNVAGLVVANTAFLLALVGFYKLVRLDYSEKQAKLIIILLLAFPTSFYFGSVYTESLFLALAVWSYYFARRDNWLAASVLGMAVTATRTIGIIMLPVLFLEYMRKRTLKDHPLKYLALLLIPLGLFAYMYYLKQTTGDWLMFLHTLSAFGEQRSSSPILLPQVFYRYIFKILPNINYSYFPLVFTTLMEFATAVAFTAISVISITKLRISYVLYLVSGFLLPTLSGSFSSLPRYVSVLFPAFILMSVALVKLPKLIQLAVIIVFTLLLSLSTALFARGYWLS